MKQVYTQMMHRLAQAADYVFPVGVRSVLFGAHCFFIHPIFVALAWWKLYGFPRDYRLWIAFFVHDLGYLVYRCQYMDDANGERHVEWGEQFMHRHFGKEWGLFCRYHSRFYAKRDSVAFSRLCVADKLSVTLEPWWLYLPRVILSGEIKEYMRLAEDTQSKYGATHGTWHANTQKRRAWFAVMTTYLRNWAYEHRDGKDDTWTRLSGK